MKEKNEQRLGRAAGILLPVSSLPSKYGIGTFGDEAYQFVDTLVEAGQKFWQVLPLGPTSFGDSPYQPLSSCAGNFYLIDLDELVEEGLLTVDEIRCYNWGVDGAGIDYAIIAENRQKILQKAFERFDESAQEYQEFVAKNEEWLGDFALYMSLKLENFNKSWLDWPEEEKNRQPVALANRRKTLYNEIGFWKFCQYEFFKQWKKLKEYANSRGVQIIGDISFFVGLDSVDVWMNKDLFLLDANGKPKCVSAVLPDKFAEEGQIWGNPVYDWDAMEADEYRWWKRRVKICSELFDVIRLDHFVGVVKNYTVPYGAKSTASGKWVKGPG